MMKLYNRPFSPCNQRFLTQIKEFLSKEDNSQNKFDKTKYQFLQALLPFLTQNLSYQIPQQLRFQQLNIPKQLQKGSSFLFANKYIKQPIRFIPTIPIQLTEPILAFDFSQIFTTSQLKQIQEPLRLVAQIYQEEFKNGAVFFTPISTTMTTDVIPSQYKHILEDTTFKCFFIKIPDILKLKLVITIERFSHDNDKAIQYYTNLKQNSYIYCKDMVKNITTNMTYPFLIGVMDVNESMIPQNTMNNQFSGYFKENNKQIFDNYSINPYNTYSIQITKFFKYPSLYKKDLSQILPLLLQQEKSLRIFLIQVKSCFLNWGAKQDKLKLQFECYPQLFFDSESSLIDNRKQQYDQIKNIKEIIYLQQTNQITQDQADEEFLKFQASLVFAVKQKIQLKQDINFFKINPIYCLKSQNQIFKEVLIFQKSKLKEADIKNHLYYDYKVQNNMLIRQFQIYVPNINRKRLFIKIQISQRQQNSKIPYFNFVSKFHEKDDQFLKGEVNTNVIQSRVYFKFQDDFLFLIPLKVSIFDQAEFVIFEINHKQEHIPIYFAQSSMLSLLENNQCELILYTFNNEFKQENKQVGILSFKSSKFSPFYSNNEEEQLVIKNIFKIIHGEDVFSLTTSHSEREEKLAVFNSSSQLLRNNIVIYIQVLIQMLFQQNDQLKFKETMWIILLLLNRIQTRDNPTQTNLYLMQEKYLQIQRKNGLEILGKDILTDYHIFKEGYVKTDPYYFQIVSIFWSTISSLQNDQIIQFQQKLISLFNKQQQVDQYKYLQDKKFLHTQCFILSINLLYTTLKNKKQMSFDISQIDFLQFIRKSLQEIGIQVTNENFIYNRNVVSDQIAFIIYQYTLISQQPEVIAQDILNCMFEPIVVWSTIKFNFIFNIFVSLLNYVYIYDKQEFYISMLQDLYYQLFKKVEQYYLINLEQADIRRQNISQDILEKFIDNLNYYTYFIICNRCDDISDQITKISLEIIQFIKINQIKMKLSYLYKIQTILLTWIFISDNDKYFIQQFDDSDIITIITNQINFELISSDISQLQTSINEENTVNRNNYYYQLQDQYNKDFLYFQFDSFQDNAISLEQKRSKNYLIQTRMSTNLYKEQRQDNSFLYRNSFNQYFDAFIFDYLILVDKYLDRILYFISQYEQTSLVNVLDLIMKLSEVKLLVPKVNDLISVILTKLTKKLLLNCLLQWISIEQYNINQFLINNMLLQKTINTSFFLLKYLNQCSSFSQIFIDLVTIQKAQNKQLDNYEVENQIYSFVVKNYNKQQINYFAVQLDTLLLSQDNIEHNIQIQINYIIDYLQQFDEQEKIKNQLQQEKLNSIVNNIKSVLNHSIQLIQSENKLLSLNKNDLVCSQQTLLNSLNFFPGYVKMHYETLQTIIGLTPENFYDDNQFLTISQVRNFDTPITHIKSLQAGYLHLLTAYYLASVIKNTKDIAISTYFQQKQINPQIGQYIQSYIYNILDVKVKHIMPYIVQFQLPTNLQSFFTTRDIIKHLAEAEQIFLLNFQNQNVFIIQSIIKQLNLLGDNKDKADKYLNTTNQIKDFEQLAQFSTNLRYGYLYGEMQIYLALQKTKIQEIFYILIDLDKSVAFDQIDNSDFSYPVAPIKQLILIEQEIEQLSDHQLTKQLLQEIIKLQMDAATQRYFNGYCYTKEQLMYLESDPLINYSNTFFTFQMVHGQLYLVLLICDQPLPSFVQSQPVSIKAYFKASPMLYGLIQLLYVSHYNKQDHLDQVLYFLQQKIITLDQAMDFKLASQFQVQQIDDVQIDAEFFDIDQDLNNTTKIFSPETRKQIKQLPESIVSPTNHQKSRLRLEFVLSDEEESDKLAKIKPNLQIQVDDTQQESDDQVVSITSAQQMLIMSPVPQTARKFYLNQDSPLYKSKTVLEDRKFFTILQEPGANGMKNSFSVESSLEIYDELFISILKKIKQNDKLVKNGETALIDFLLEQLEKEKYIVVDNTNEQYGDSNELAE